jgi:hypothetical protein
MRTEMKFDLHSQEKYAELSGDFNPIHVDPVYARRSPLGVVAHGVHVVLRGLDHFLKGHEIEPRKITAVFLKPVRLGEPFFYESVEEECSWRINAIQSGAISATIKIESKPSSQESMNSVESEHDLGGTKLWTRDEAKPHAKSFSDLVNETGSVEVSGSDVALRAEFPNLAAKIGTHRIAALNALSRLVGMVCPGLNSLFSGFDVSLEALATGSIAYQAGRLRSPQAPFKINVSGGGLQGELSVFVRPEPVRQLSFAEAKSKVNADEFANIRALVVGGSRGLGEVVTKLLAAGGANVTLTFNQGRGEADAICSEISAAGGHVEAKKLDLLGEDGGDWVTNRRFNQVYFFSTPLIRANLAGKFHAGLYSEFMRFYVDGFLRLYGQVGENECRFLYPSTVYVAERPKGFAEYVAAKEAGEALAKAMNELSGFKRVVVARLPRMATDQTNTFTGAKSLSPVEVVLNLIRNEMSFSKGEQS